MIIYYQTDFFEFPADIVPEVDLVITSPPSKLLDTRMSDIFDTLIPMMHPDGWILFDMPEGYNQRVIALYDAIRQRHNWHWAETYRVENMYPGFPPQRLYLIKRVENDISVPYWTSGGRLKCDTFQPKHYCEFNQDFIRLMITHYSKKGDLVFDPFAGSGTVPKMACALGRTGVGTEIKGMYDVYNDSR